LVGTVGMRDMGAIRRGLVGLHECYVI